MNEHNTTYIDRVQLDGRFTVSPPTRIQTLNFMTLATLFAVSNISSVGIENWNLLCWHATNGKIKNVLTKVYICLCFSKKYDWFINLLFIFLVLSNTYHVDKSYQKINLFGQRYSTFSTHGSLVSSKNVGGS